MRSNTQQKRIWMAWEKQRRSLELSKSFNCDFFLIIEKGLLRYPISIVKTFRIIQRERPDVLFVQNPSMILAVFVTCFFRFFFKYYIVVDRHSNFLLTEKKRSFWFESCFHFLSYLSIRFADLTIVTNKEISHVVDILGGHVMVLPDKVPSLSPSIKTVFLKGAKNILVISSFADDEPIREIAEAASKFSDDDIKFYFSGNYKEYSDIDHIITQKNIVLTGFLDDQNFVDILFSVDIVMVLTTMKHTLLCGCYEAVAAGKVLITSDTSALRALFKGAVFVGNANKDIADGIRYALVSANAVSDRMAKLKSNMHSKWEKQFNKINNYLIMLT